MYWRCEVCGHWGDGAAHVNPDHDEDHSFSFGVDVSD